VPGANGTLRLTYSASIKVVISLAEPLSQFVSGFHHQRVLVPTSLDERMLSGNSGPKGRYSDCRGSQSHGLRGPPF